MRSSGLRPYIQIQKFPSLIPQGACLVFGTQPCYKAPCDLVETSKTLINLRLVRLPFTVAQSWLWAAKLQIKEKSLVQIGEIMKSTYHRKTMKLKKTEVV